MSCKKEDSFNLEQAHHTTRGALEDMGLNFPRALGHPGIPGREGHVDHLLGLGLHGSKLWDIGRGTRSARFTHNHAQYYRNSTFVAAISRYFFRRPHLARYSYGPKRP